MDDEEQERSEFGWPPVIVMLGLFTLIGWIAWLLLAG